MSHFQLTNSLLFATPKSPTFKRDSNAERQSQCRAKREDREEAKALGLQWPDEYCQVMGVNYE